MSCWREFLTIVVAHGLAVASPGPDFAIVLRQSLVHGRRAGVWTSVGIGCGLSVHISYCVLGLAFVLRHSPAALSVVKYLGAAYLASIGLQALRSRPRAADLPAAPVPPPDARGAWTTGFLVNLLNPKAALFFLALFPLAVSPATPRLIQVGYGLWMALTTVAWFSFVAFVFTREEVRRKFLRHGHWIDRMLGIVFLGFAVSLAFAVVG
jgi:RhtB (resistance to homoserine/threonine) family protein